MDINVRLEKKDMEHTQVQYQRPNELRHRAERLLEQGTAIIGKMSADEIARLVEELHASHGELLRQNAELSRIQAELEESRDKLSDLYDFVPVGYFTFDQDYLITDANHTAADLLGVDRDALVARAFTDFVAPGFKDIFVHHCARSVEKRTIQTCPLKLVKDNGCEFYAQLDSLAVKDDKSGHRRIRISVTDVTERRRVIAEVMRLAAIVESSDDAIIGEDLDNRITSWNRAAERIYGYSADEVRGKSISMLLPPDDPDRVAILLEKLGRGERIDHFETVHMTRDGRRIHVSLTISPIQDTEGNIVGASTIARNITEHKKAEDELRKSEEHYRMLAETMNDGLGQFDANGISVYVNEKYGEIFGYTRAEILGRHRRELFDRDAQEIMELQLVARRKGHAEPYEFSTTRKDGRKIHVRVSPQPIFDDNGVFKGSLSIVTDITKRKQSESILQLSHEILRVAQQSTDLKHMLENSVATVQRFFGVSAVGIRLLDEQGNIPYKAYEGFSETFYKSESPLSVCFDKCMCINVIKGTANSDLPFFTEYGSFYMNGTSAFLATVSGDVKGETRNTCNEEGYESVALVPIRDKDGIIGLIHVADKRENMVPLDKVKALEAAALHLGDAVLRVRAEEEVRKSEQKMRSILDGFPDAILQVGMDLKVLWANKAALALNPDVLGRSCCDVYQASVSAEEGQCVCKKAIESGRIEAYSLCFPAADEPGGEVCWENIGVPLGDSHGRVYGAILIARDVTERKTAERVMLEYQNRLRTQASQLSLAEERERRRIATDLHDNVIQGLALSMIKLGLLRESSEGIDEALFGEVSETLNRAIDDMRNMTFDISSPTLYKLGLSAAVDELLDDMVCRQHSIDYEFADDEQKKPLDDDVAVLLFQSIRELFVNIIKHAEAQKVTVCIERVGESVCIIVSDDGVGFDVDHTDLTMHRTGGFGLFNIRERLDYIGGSIEIQSLPGQGSTFVLIAPLKK